MVHGQPDRAAGAVRLHLWTAPSHAWRHPPSDLGYHSRSRTGRARICGAGNHCRLDLAHAHRMGGRLSRHGRPAMKDNQMRTPMSRVRGLGAAHSGTQDFWRQRLTSVAGIPLCIAAIVIVIALLGRSHAAVVQILGSPIVAITMLLFIINIVYHMWIGMQEIIVDYVHEDKLKLATLLGNTFFCFAIGLAST